MAKTVVAALLAKQNRLLVCQRSAAGDFPGKWEFPGGKVEPGETPPAALRRELEEELGIAADIGEELWRVEYQYPGRAPVLLIFYAVHRCQGELQNRVFQQIAWASAGELEQYDFLEADRELIQRLASGDVRVTGLD